MRQMKIVLALSLAFLTGAASVSAGVCDLSCSLQQASSECHGVSSATDERSSASAMSMPGMPDMNTSSQSAATSGADKPVSGHDQSGQNPPVCPHKACTQISTTSPQGANHFHFASSLNTVSVGSPVCCFSNVACLESAWWTPPKIPSLAPLTVSLRI